MSSLVTIVRRLTPLLLIVLLLAPFGTQPVSTTPTSATGELAHALLPAAPVAHAAVAPADQPVSPVLASPTTSITLTGTIQDAFSNPIVGATVFLGLPNDPEVSAQTDSTGQYTLILDTGATTTVSVNVAVLPPNSTARTAQFTFSADPPATITQNFTLNLLQITGTVKDESTSAPIPNATVEASFFSSVYDTVEVTGITDAQGNFTLLADAGGNPFDSVFVSLTVTAPGYVGTSSSKFTQVSTGADFEDIFLTFFRFFGLSGTLLDDATGTPLANASGTVSLRAENGSFLDSAFVGTDSTGKFNATFDFSFFFTPPASGNYLLQFSGVSAGTVQIPGVPFFVTDTFPDQFHNQGKATSQLANPVAFTQNQTTTLTTRLVKGTRIAGQLNDALPNGTADSTRPITGSFISLSVYQGTGNRDFVTGLGLYLNPNTGQYTSTETLLPGSYVFEFGASGSSRVPNGYYRRFHNNQNTLPAATVVNLASTPAIRTGINAALYRSTVLTGRVTDAATTQVITNTDLSLNYYDPANNLPVFSEFDFIDSNGFYTTTLFSDVFLTLPQGELQFDPSSSKYVSRWFNNKDNRADADLITLLGVAPTSQNGVDRNIVTADVALREGGSIVGRVVDSGTPTLGITNTTVSLYRADNPFFAVATTQTYSGQPLASTGVYTFTGLPAGEYRIAFSPNFGSDYLASWFNNKGSFNTADRVAVQLDQRTTVADAPLQRARKLEVYLTEDGTTPIITTTFTVLLYDARTGGFVDSDFVSSDGIARFGGLRPGQYQVQIFPNAIYRDQWFDRARVRQSATTIDLRTATQPVSRTARLERGIVGVASLTGQLTDAATGTPIANDLVELYDSFSGQPIRTAVTNNSGVYSITEILTGTYQIRFGGTTTYAPEWFDNQPTQDSASVVTLSGTTPTVIDAALARGGSLQVVVRAADTQFPLANVAVTAVNPATGASVFDFTGSDGLARFNGLAPGEYEIVIGAVGEYIAQSDPITATIVSEQRTRVNIALQRGARLIGQVLDESDSTPLAGVQVSLFDAGIEEQLFMFTGSTDAQGRYEIPGVVPGNYKVRFSRFGYVTKFADNSPTWTNANTVAIAGTTIRNAQLAQNEAVGALIGTVTLDPTGSPARNVQVKLYDALTKDQVGLPVTTDTRGEYRFTSVPSNTYLVRFVPPATSGYAIEWFDNKFRVDQATPVAVTTGQAVTADAVLSPAPAKIAGVVTAADTGEPLAGVQVGVFIQDTGERVGVRNTNAQGVYTVTGLISGTYVVQAGPFSPYSSQWFDGKTSRLTADPVTATTTIIGTADFALQANALTGQVNDSAGQPVPGAFIQVSGDNGFFSTRTTATGAYTVTGLAAGEYVVKADPTPEQRELFGFITTYHPDATSQSEATRVVMPISGTVRADVTMQQGVDFTAVVVDETTQEPLGGMRVSLSGVFAQETSDASGRVRFESIAPRSNYFIRIDPPTLGPLTRYPQQWYDRVRRIELADSVSITATTSLTIPLSTEPIEARATLEGTVLSSSDVTTPTLAAVALPDVQVELYRVGEQRPVASTTTNDGGTFRFVDVFPGDYEVYFRTPTFGPARSFASQWYDGVATRDQARLLALRLGETTSITATLAARPIDSFVTPAGTGDTPITSADGRIALFFPAGAVTDTINIRITTLLTTELSPQIPSPTQTALLYFETEAIRASTGERIRFFNELISATVKLLSPFSILLPNTQTRNIEVLFWDGTAWISATDIPPCRLAGCSQQVNKDTNEIEIRLDHFSLFAVIDTQARETVYLPLVVGPPAATPQEPTPTIEPTPTLTITVEPTTTATLEPTLTPTLTATATISPNVGMQIAPIPTLQARREE